MQTSTVSSDEIVILRDQGTSVPAMLTSWMTVGNSRSFSVLKCLPSLLCSSLLKSALLLICEEGA